MSSRARAVALLHMAKNWEDFNQHVRHRTEKEKGCAFEVLVQCFLLVNPKYATTLCHVWTLEEVPVSVRRHLNLPRPDEGIDLVAQTQMGEYWAIQCKYREPVTKSLRRSELATFTDLTFGICKHITLALVCTTANRYSHKLRLYEERLQFCSGDVWQALDEGFFDRVRALLDGRQVRAVPNQPRPHQDECVQHAIEHFARSGHDRGKLIMPCGTGKSLTAYWIAAALDATTIVIAAPSLALIRQTIDVWTRESVALERDIKWIAVCSDDSVADVDASLLTQDLGIRVHTNAHDIALWLGATKHCRSVVFTTYHSGPIVADAARRAQVSFDLGIFDEAHRTVGRKGSRFSHLLHDENVPIHRRLFMTATERRYRGESEDIASMDDVQLYGQTFALLSFKAALAASPPILCDYKVLTVAVSREEVADLIRSNALVQPDKGDWDFVEAETLATSVALRKAMRQYAVGQTISFHSSVARAANFTRCQDSLTAAFPEYGPLRAFHVSGAMPAGDRTDVMREFTSAECALVTNARCLTEGVDVPKVDCVLFADPRSSAIDIVQAVGRALRPSEGKQCAYIVVPIIIDRLDDEAALTSAFAPVISVLRALAANDERIIEYFRSIAEGPQRPPHHFLSIDLPLGMRIDIDAFVSAIETQCWSRLARLSWRPFDAAREYVRHLGLEGQSAWRAYIVNELPVGALPKDIPRAPDNVYKGCGWTSWGDWLGTGAIASQQRRFRSFSDARTFVRALGLRSHQEWLRYCAGALPGLPPRPDDIPSLPGTSYRSVGWAGWGDWFGTAYVANRSRRYLPFAEARAFARGLGFNCEAEWRRYIGGNRSAFPEGVPRKPDVVYRGEGWKGWGDWLGTERIANQERTFLPFAEARRFVHALKLKGYHEWELYRVGRCPGKGKRPLDIPSDPYGHYKNKGSVNWPDWLGLR